MKSLTDMKLDHAQVSTSYCDWVFKDTQGKYDVLNRIPLNVSHNLLSIIETEANKEFRLSILPNIPILLTKFLLIQVTQLTNKSLTHFCDHLNVPTNLNVMFSDDKFDLKINRLKYICYSSDSEHSKCFQMYIKLICFLLEKT